MNGTLLGIPDLALVAIALFIVIQIIQDRTRFGRYLYAIGGDEVLAAQAGVNVDRTKIIVFGIAGLFYGLSALFLAVQLDSAQAITGNNLLFPAVTAVAVGGVALTGGIGGAKNAALGALIVTALNDGLDSAQRQSICAGSGERNCPGGGCGADHRPKKAWIHQIEQGHDDRRHD